MRASAMLGAGAAALAISLGGCVYQEPVPAYSYYNPYDPGQRAAAGAMLGAGAGAAVGGIAGGGRGAAIGALTGGAVGAIAGAGSTPAPYDDDYRDGY